MKNEIPTPFQNAPFFSFLSMISASSQLVLHKQKENEITKILCTIKISPTHLPNQAYTLLPLQSIIPIKHVWQRSHNVPSKYTRKSLMCSKVCLGKDQYWRWIFVRFFFWNHFILELECCKLQSMKAITFSTQCFHHFFAENWVSFSFSLLCF